ncbi:site-specific integrase [Thalassobium sp. R2A62]|uniref:site-specific integrase n=1 Tax=Thalassobium sp. R2A62 TaxID=633131 RepID=UPI0001B1CD65|nr:site-specific integrase [Thalassobium sp. R2A62]EET48365.1 site-specific recombinase, phage integrase family [Thalassobium sp. R2A62]
MNIRTNLPTREQLTVRYHNGKAYNLNDLKWGPFVSGGNNHNISFERLAKVCTPELLNAIKATASARLESVTAAAVKSDMLAVSAFAELVIKGRAPGSKLATITADDIREFTLKSESKNYLVPAKFFVLEMLSHEYLAPDAELQNEVTRTTPKKTSCIHILTLDPNEGPYLDSEILAIDQALQEAYDKGKISDHDYLLAMTVRLYGQRPISNAALKLGDVQTPALTGENRTQIRFPIRKKISPKFDRGPLRPTPMFYAHVLEKHALKRKEEDSEIPWQERALFTPPRGKNSLDDPELEGHFPSESFSAHYRRMMLRLKVISPRTGKPMRITANRDRHTVGTLLAIQGCTAEVIAAWLEHDSLQSCEAYVEVATRHHQQMSSLLDGKFMHAAARFTGEVITEEELDDFALSTVVSDFESRQPKLGGCASGGCGALDDLSAPFACFLCPKFRLSKKAHLTPLLEGLVAKRREAKSVGDTEFASTIDRHIAAIHAAQKELEK